MGLRALRSHAGLAKLRARWPQGGSSLAVCLEGGPSVPPDRASHEREVYLSFKIPCNLPCNLDLFETCYLFSFFCISPFWNRSVSSVVPVRQQIFCLKTSALAGLPPNLFQLEGWTPFFLSSILKYLTRHFSEYSK